jgi:thiopeptide-type bacteriocin biosynthesis protein
VRDHGGAIVIWRQLDIDLGPRPKDVADEVFARMQPAIDPTHLWFVRKPPGLRVRAKTEVGGTDVLTRIAAELRDDGVVVSAREGVYEPEARRFGGARAMERVHAFFHVDSRGFIAWHRRRAEARLAPAVVSLAVISTLFDRLLAGAGSEIWDAWANLASLHGIEHGIEHDATARPLLPPTFAQLHALAADHESAVLADYDHGCHALAEGVDALRREGDFRVGVRAFAADVALFHWNRWGIAEDERVELCEGALAAFHPHRRKQCP